MLLKTMNLENQVGEFMFINDTQLNWKKVAKGASYVKLPMKKVKNKYKKQRKTSVEYPVVF